ncbi:MAG: cation:proton antiporter [Candidatus Bathyarchaeota archaeon]|nr:cation:proton antiporter [Candidatus Termiticorpusculum sp.]MCL1970610.1 cation:proton antiporter [Candidatus Termiticorpusculum sp.]
MVTVTVLLFAFMVLSVSPLVANALNTPTLSANSGFVNDTITVSGSGALEDGEVSIYWDNISDAAPLNVTSTSGAGTYRANITIPKDATTGKHFIVVTDNTTSVSAEFTVETKNNGNGNRSSSAVPISIVIFGIVAMIIAIGFAGEFLTKKAGIPIFIIIILIGIILGPILGIFPRENLLSTLPIFATLTLLMVLFYAGLGLKSQSVVAIGGRVFVQTTIYTFASIAAIGALGYFGLKWDLLQSLIFAAIIGGEITAAVIVPLSATMKLKEKTVAFLTMESAISSVFSVVLFSTLVDIHINSTSGGVFSAVSGIAGQFSIGIIIGLILSLLWVYILYRLQKYKFTHVLTIGLVLATYSITELLTGSGILAVLVFGIVFGNYHLASKLLKVKMNLDNLQQQLKGFYEEISFLLETLFFVSLGLIFVIDTKFLLYGIMFTVVLLIMRFGSVRISTAKSSLSQQKSIITLMCALGLTPATLAILAVTYNREFPDKLQLADTFVSVITCVIILTNIITAIGTAYYLSKQRKAKKTSEQQQLVLEES